MRSRTWRGAREVSAWCARRGRMSGGGPSGAGYQHVMGKPGSACVRRPRSILGFEVRSSWHDGAPKLDRGSPWNFSSAVWLRAMSPPWRALPCAVNGLSRGPASARRTAPMPPCATAPITQGYRANLGKLLELRKDR